MPAPLRSRERRAVLVSGALSALAATRLARADSPPTVLTLTGRVQPPAGASAVQLARADLDRLPQHAFTTASPWYRQPMAFSGPLLRDVLALAGASGSQLRARALNDYQVVIPMDDARRWDVIVASRMNGQLLTVRDKGPLFVVYPYDSSSELRRATYYERSIWQLALLAVE